jgi:hypothetical protein
MVGRLDMIMLGDRADVRQESENRLRTDGALAEVGKGSWRILEFPSRDAYEDGCVPACRPGQAFS